MERAQKSAFLKYQRFHSLQDATCQPKDHGKFVPSVTSLNTVKPPNSGHPLNSGQNV